MTESYEFLTVPGPIPTPVSQPFWDAASRGEFDLQRCDDCARWFFYPRAHCPHCWSARVSWRPASGRGVIKTYSVVHRPGHFAWAAVAPYTLALVALEEGPTMLSQLTGPGLDDVAVGRPVRVRWVQVGQFNLPFFELADAVHTGGNHGHSA